VGKNRQQRKQNMNFSRSNVSIVTTMDILWRIVASHLE
jgi:hypothetical protein